MCVRRWSWKNLRDIFYEDASRQEFLEFGRAFRWSARLNDGFYYICVSNVHPSTDDRKIRRRSAAENIIATKCHVALWCDDEVVRSVWSRDEDEYRKYQRRCNVSAKECCYSEVDSLTISMRCVRWKRATSVLLLGYGFFHHFKHRAKPFYEIRFSERRSSKRYFSVYQTPLVRGNFS